MPYVISVYILLSSVNIVALEDLDLGFNTDLSDTIEACERTGPFWKKGKPLSPGQPFCLVPFRAATRPRHQEKHFSLSSVRSVDIRAMFLYRSVKCVAEKKGKYHEGFNIGVHLGFHFV